MSIVAPLPPGARLVHVGPHKTGSTALQSACHHARAELLAQGVTYVGRRRHEISAARWRVQRMVAGGNAAFGERRWQAVVEELSAESAHRRFFSSELLSDAADHHVDAVLEDLGTEDLWIVLTLRPLALILPSQYQQGLQHGVSLSYADYLRMLFEDPEHSSARAFWVRHRVDHLARRWAARLGAERVLAVVTDPGDRSFLPHAFEDLLGVRRGTLAEVPSLQNRSLTAEEAGLLLRFNRQSRPAGIDPALYVRLLRTVGPHLKERVPGPDERRLETPDWAITRANELSAEMAADLVTAGVQVIGDLDSMSQVPLSGLQAAQEAPAEVGVDLAAWFATGLAGAMRDHRARLEKKVRRHAGATAD